MRDLVTSGVSRRRRLYGVAVALLGGPLLVLVLLPARDALGLDTVLLAFVLVSVAASATGGVIPAMLASVVSFALANFFFAPPYGTLVVGSAAELIDLLVFLAVTVVVGVITEMGARARERTERERARVEWLTSLEAVGRTDETLATVLAEAQRSYAVDWVGLMQGHELLAATGPRPQTGQVWRASAGAGQELQLIGSERIGVDLNPLSSLAATAGRLWRASEVAERARRAEELARIDEVRAALLAAVGHDLRGPLAAIRTATDTLAAAELTVTVAERNELLSTISEHVERLSQIISNLLDLSRLQAGVLSVRMQPVSVLEVMAGLLRPGREWAIDIPEELPAVMADPGLLERVLENLVANAERHAPNADAVVQARQRGQRVRVAVIDHGPGIPEQRLAEVFRPFQHFSDSSADTGVGLGLAIVSGFCDAMGVRVTPSQTPGGGLTMTVEMEVARSA